MTDRLITAPLPSWVSPEAAALIADIIASRPSCYVTEGEPYNCGGRLRYRGKAAGALRRLWQQKANELSAEADAEFRRGVPWTEAGAELNAFFASDEPDALIDRLLRESEEMLLTEEVHGDPLRRAA